MARAPLVALAVVAATAAGCGSSEHAVRLEGGTEATGGKALVFSASTDKKLALEKGGTYAVELRGINTDSGDASFDRAGYVDKRRCVKSPCEWTVMPTRAGRYEYKAFLIDLRGDKAAGGSDGVKVDWTAPPRPQAITLLVNGKTPQKRSLGSEEYSDFPAGPMQGEAKWTTDARDTGYYLRISANDRAYARCSTGTSCRVPVTVPLGVGKEVSWKVELMTTRGDKVAGGFKVCLEGAA